MKIGLTENSTSPIDVDVLIALSSYSEEVKDFFSDSLHIGESTIFFKVNFFPFRRGGVVGWNVPIHISTEKADVNYSIIGGRGRVEGYEPVLRKDRMNEELLFSVKGVESEMSISDFYLDGGMMRVLYLD